MIFEFSSQKTYFFKNIQAIFRSSSFMLQVRFHIFVICVLIEITHLTQMCCTLSIKTLTAAHTRITGLQVLHMQGRINGYQMVSLLRRCLTYTTPWDIIVENPAFWKSQFTTDKTLVVDPRFISRGIDMLSNPKRETQALFRICLFVSFSLVCETEKVSFVPSGLVHKWLWCRM